MMLIHRKRTGNRVPRIRSVKFNVLMNMVVTCSSLAFPLVTVPYVSRVLSTGGMGYVAFAQSVSSYFSLVALLGMTYYGVRACAAVRDDPDALAVTVRELLVILLVSTGVVSVGYLVALFTVPAMRGQFALFLVFGLTIWLSSFGVEWFYQALEQYGYIAVRNVCFKLAALVLMFVFVHARGDYVVYGVITVLAGYGSNVLNLLRLRRLVDLSRGGRLRVRRHFKPMFWFMVAAVSSGMYIQVDVVMLGFLGTNTMVGLYQLVSKVKSVLVTAVNSVGNVMLPRLSYYQSRHDHERADVLVAKNLNFVMVAGCAVVALLAVCAEPIVALLGGPDFAGSAAPLRCVGVAVACSAMNIVLANHMISNGMERRWASVNVVGLATAAIANLVLIPRFGVVGSAIGISLCEALMLAMRSVICRALLRRIRRLLDPLRIIAAALVAGLAGWAAGETVPWGNAWILLATQGLAFALAYALLLVLVRERFVCAMAQPLLARMHGMKGAGA